MGAAATRQRAGEQHALTLTGANIERPAFPRLLADIDAQQIDERTRDKIAGARRKGKWTGPSALSAARPVPGVRHGPYALGLS
jgi:DNA invertase Pin-like site-specific DNA recombinase